MPLPLARRFRPVAAALASTAVAGAAMLASSPRALSQTMLTGCQLVGGTLQCVPGVTADPQQQINDLRQQIGTDQQLENAVEQRIEGLSQLVLVGEIVEGSLLVANLGAGLPQDPLVQLPASAFHWYRLTPGSTKWVLIPGASGPTYRLQHQDVGSQLMVVVAVATPSGSQRQPSAVIGPIVGR